MIVSFHGQGASNTRLLEVLVQVKGECCKALHQLECLWQWCFYCCMPVTHSVGQGFAHARHKKGLWGARLPSFPEARGDRWPVPLAPSVGLVLLIAGGWWSKIFTFLVMSTVLLLVVTGIKLLPCHLGKEPARAHLSRKSLICVDTR